MNYLIGFLLMGFLFLGVPLFFNLLGFIPLPCPECKKRALKKISETEQPGYGVLITYKCSSCGHSKNKFIKVR